MVPRNSLIRLCLPGGCTGEHGQQFAFLGTGQIDDDPRMIHPQKIDGMVKCPLQWAKIPHEKKTDFGV